MDWWLLTFFIGAILSLFLPEVPALFQLFLLFLLAISFFLHKRSRSSAGLWFGALWVLVQAYAYHNQLPHSVIDLIQAKQRFIIEGEVVSLVVTQEKLEQRKSPNSSPTLIPDTTTRFNFLVNKVNNEPIKIPFKVRLSWKKSTFEMYQGNLLSLKVKLKPAHGLANVGTFNYLRWLKANNIVATGYVVSDKINKNQGKVNIPIHLKPEIKNKRLQDHTSYRQQLFDQYQQLTLSSLGRNIGRGDVSRVDKSYRLKKLTPILFALTFGERSLLDKSHWQVLQATGTSHLIAISGLHVGLLAGSVFFIVMIILRYLPLRNNNCQHINIRYLAILFSLLFAGFYTYLAGFSLPTQRALVMLNLYWLSRLIGIKLSLKRLVLIALFILIIISPFSLLTASFWLSFYAVAIIFVTLWRFKYWLRNGSTVYMFFKGLIVIQIALTLMLLPITALFFHEVSLVSLLANIVAVPWMSMVSIPAALLSLLLMPISETLAQWCLIASLNSLSWLWYYLELLSNQTNAMLSLSYLQQLFVSVLGGITFVLCYIAPIRWRIPFKKTVIFKIGFVLAIGCVMTSDKSITILSNVNSLEEKSKFPRKDKLLYKHNDTAWQAVFLDVGQGLSVLIKRNEHVVLYDTGAAYPSGFNMSEAVILPFLKYSGIKKIDKVILSHSDNDHAGGINQLLAGIAIDEIFSNVSVVKGTSHLPRNVSSHITDHTQSYKTRMRTCEAGRRFIWQGLTFKVLWPITQNLLPTIQEPLNEKLKLNLKAKPKAKPKQRAKQKNDDSCVVLITDEKGKKLLLTGDISTKVERQLVVLYPELSINVLQVPHHGSKTSSSELFIKHLSPSIAVVSAGFYNRWNMPVSFVEERYQELGVELFNNAEEGQVTITFDKEGMSTKTYVNHLQPFWFNH